MRGSRLWTHRRQMQHSKWVMVNLVMRPVASMVWARAMSQPAAAAAAAVMVMLTLYQHVLWVLRCQQQQQQQQQQKCMLCCPAATHKETLLQTVSSIKDRDNPAIHSRPAVDRTWSTEGNSLYNLCLTGRHDGKEQWLQGYCRACVCLASDTDTCRSCLLVLLAQVLSQVDRPTAHDTWLCAVVHMAAHRPVAVL